MVVGIGIDIIEIGRFEQALARHRRLVDRLFTDREIAYCNGRGCPAASLAARFAAKEAVYKACSRVLSGRVIGWREVEVVMDSGRPEICLAAEAAGLVAGHGIVKLEVSLSHSREYACAMVVAESGE